MGNTSITFKIEARKVSVYTGEEDVVVTTNTTFVRIDEEGKPTPIPTIVKERFQRQTNLNTSFTFFNVIGLSKKDKSYACKNPP